MIVVVVLVLAGVAVLGAVVVLAMGRGGELAETHPDYPPLRVDAEGRPVIGANARFRFPPTIWGYQMQVTDEAVHRLTEALYERDARVADLERQLRDLRGRVGAEPARSVGAEPEPARSVGALHGLDEASAGNGTSPPLRADTARDAPEDTPMEERP